MILEPLSPLGGASRRGINPRLAHAATNASLPGGVKMVTRTLCLYVTEMRHCRQYPEPALTAW
eukprot:6240608-Pyramimonas_sp.AAC.1